MSTSPKDNFSKQADAYARFRPSYPTELVEFILTHVPARNRAWDCATGNGQAAVALANHFEIVDATDLSPNQLNKATQRPNIRYQVARAEEPPFPDHSFDLITVAQAFHWFDHPPFFKEVKRILKPGGILAVFGYDLPTLPAAISQDFRNYYHNTLDAYWDVERQLVEEHYHHVKFELEELPCPLFSFALEWTTNHLEGFLNSWSATQHYIRQNGHNPVDQVMEAVHRHWDRSEPFKVTFPIFMRMGRA